ncbi:MAG: archease [Thermoplasmata archaeon]|nr:archease [Thermoplasmata archaeon]
MGGPRRRIRYGSFPTTADVGIWASAPEPNGVFEGLGRALFALMTDLRTIRPTEARAVSASGADPPSLLVAYLNELVQLHDTEGFVAREVEVRLVGSPPSALVASLRGERFDAARHPSHQQVKAVTWHDVRLDLAAGRGRVIVDI